MSVLDRLDSCLALLDSHHRQAQAGEIRKYCRRIDRLLAHALTLLATPDAEITGQYSTYFRVVLYRWARGVIGAVDEAALLRCDPRVEQSLTDLVAILREEVRERACGMKSYEAGEPLPSAERPR